MKTATVLVKSVSRYEQPAVDLAVEEAFRRFLPDDLAGKTVAVKPNLLLARTPENASTTHPAVVSAVCRAIGKRGGTALIVESGGGPITPSSPEKLYETTGMKKAAEESGAALNFDCSSEKMPAPQGKTRKEFLVLSSIRRADLIVSVAKLKTHGFMKMTASVKNLYGTIPGLHKAMMHREYPGKKEFASMICDLAEAFRPALNITDAIVGMEGEGPSGGTPVRTGLLLASDDPFASDVVAAAIMGIRPQEAPILREAIERKLVPASADEIETEGDDWRGKRPYRFPGEKKSILGLLPGVLRYPIEDMARAYPYISDRCVSCGKCAGICPQKAIRKGEKRFRVHIDQCIRCYCCHEICPEKAIDMVRKGKYPKNG